MDININNLKIIKAIKYVECQIELYHNVNDIPYTKGISWIYYTCKGDDAYKNELISRYSQFEKSDIRYYLWFHGCYDTVIFYWTIVKRNGYKNVQICLQNNHAYIKYECGKIYDPLTNFCNPNFDYEGNIITYDNPYNFVLNTFMDPTDLRDWELKDLSLLKELE